LNPNGKTVAAGLAGIAGTDRAFALARYEQVWRE